MSAFRIGRLDIAIAGSRLTLGGRIDDASPLGDLPGKLPAGDVTIDTDGVTFINSIGMREWLRLLRALRARGEVRLERVADIVMAQMNLIPELTGVTIVSFHAQYVCPKCGSESAPLIDAVANAADLRMLRAPHPPCPECHAAMDLADFPERYLSIFVAPKRP